MNITMNYLNENNEMEEVSVLGYFGDSGFTSRDYCECWSETRGHFAAPIQKLYSISNKKNEKCVGHIFTYEDGYCIKDNTGRIVSTHTTKDLLDWCSEQENIGEILDRIINKD